VAKPRTRRKTVVPKRVYVPSVPAEVGWIESDRYDRGAWREICSDAASTIGQLAESGEQLVPHFPALLQDLFLALFKYNVVWLEPDQVRKSAALNRTILTALIPGAPFQSLKQRVTLEEDKAAIAAIVLGEQVLETIRSEQFLNRREMLDAWDIQHQEQDLEEKSAALKTALEMASNPENLPPGDDTMAEKLAKLTDAAERSAQVAEARLNNKARAFEETLKNANQNALTKMATRSAGLADEIDRVADETHEFSLEFGQAGKLSAGQRLELGRRLARNKKIANLARLVGRFKQDARALRRKTLERGDSEVYDIERGSNLGRLIPAELVALRHPLLVHDFKRRLLEGEVLQYQLRQDEQKGKGPMIVCLDVSSSMEGEKELWGKAVTLTLMDIARRQRRLFRAVLFSSGPDSLKVLDLNRERRYEPELPKVLELAEYFPGGGTEFERPLDAALALLELKKLKRGDIVFITDGESQVSPEWLGVLQERKHELEFKIFSVLVDIGSNQVSTLAQFSDKITSISKLNSQSTREIFLSV